MECPIFSGGGVEGCPLAAAPRLARGRRAPLPHRADSRCASPLPPPSLRRRAMRPQGASPLGSARLWPALPRRAFTHSVRSSGVARTSPSGPRRGAVCRVAMGGRRHHHHHHKHRQGTPGPAPEPEPEPAPPAPALVVRRGRGGRGGGRRGSEEDEEANSKSSCATTDSGYDGMATPQPRRRRRTANKTFESDEESCPIVVYVPRHRRPRRRRPTASAPRLSADHGRAWVHTAPRRVVSECSAVPVDVM